MVGVASKLVSGSTLIKYETKNKLTRKKAKNTKLLKRMVGAAGRVVVLLSFVRENRQTAKTKMALGTHAEQERRTCRVMAHSLCG